MDDTSGSEDGRTETTADRLPVSDNWFRNVFDHSSIGIGLVNKDGRFMRTNHAFRRMLGYSEAELNTRTFMDVTHPEDLSVSTDQVRRVLNGELTDFQVEKRYFDKNGKVVWSLTRVTAVRDGAGKPLHLMAEAQDITQRRQAESALRESEQRFRRLVEDSADAIFLHDPEGVLVDVNDQACSSLGYTRDELLGMSVQDIDKGTPPVPFNRLWKQMKLDSPATVEGIHRRRDGTTFPVEVRIAKIGTSDEPLVLAIARDITQRKQSQYALRESEQRLRTIFESAPIGIANVDREGKFLQVNPALQKMLGYTEEELKHLKFADITYPDDIDTSAKAFRELRKGKRDTVFLEKRYRLKNGESKWSQLAISAVRDADGDLAFTIVMVQDVTERKRAEADRRESEERFRSVLAAVPDLIFVLDAEGRYRHIFTAEPEMLVKPTDVLLGQSIHDVLPPNDAQSIQAVIDRTIATGQLQQFEYPLMIQEMQMWFSARVVPFTADRDPAVLWLSRDITDRKQAEVRERLHQDQLAHVSRLNTMGEMATGLAHELNQPLAAIANFANGCLQRLRSNADPREFAEALSQITHQTERAGAIIRRIRNFIHKHDIERAAVAINEIVREVTRFTASEADHLSVRTHLELAADLAPIPVDRIQIEQVLVNLVRNALESMGQCPEADRRLTIRTAATEDGQVEISVCDRGPGLPEDERERVFEPFYSNKTEGMGMGLTISRSIAEAHAGRLSAEENPEGGCIFRLILPATGNHRA